MQQQTPECSSQIILTSPGPGCVMLPVPVGTLDHIRDKIPQHLKPRICRSDRWVSDKVQGLAGYGTDSPDMLTLVVKTKLDTLTNLKVSAVCLFSALSSSLASSMCVCGGGLPQATRFLHFFGGGQPLLCWAGEGQQTHGVPWLAKALVTPLIESQRVHCIDSNIV